MKLEVLTVIFLVPLFSNPADSHPVLQDRWRRSSTQESEDFAVNFLQNFGYFPESKESSDGLVSLMTEEKLREETGNAIKLYQKTFGLPETGVIDKATMDQMVVPRCGMRDDEMIPSSRSKRFAIHGSTWQKKDVRYKFKAYSRKLPKSEQEYTIQKAFDLWANVTPLSFRRVSRDAEADIIIQFASGGHGDSQPFDGPVGILAHAFYPKYGGSAHFDEAETWTVGSKSGINLFQVAAHEFGHALGLAHSRVRGSLMFPSYQGYSPNYKLPADDIEGIQHLYPLQNSAVKQQETPTTTTTRRTTTTTTTPRTTSSTTRRTSRTTRPTTTTTTTSRTPNRGRESPRGSNYACDVRQWDAVVTTHDKNTYFFAGDYYFKNGERQGRLIAADWRDLPTPVDSAVTLTNGFTVFTKGDKFVVFHNQRPYDSAARDLETYYPGVSKTWDAAWVWGGNNQLYVTKGTQYWRYNENQRAYDSYFPLDYNTVWKGAPERLDAADTDGAGVTHFFLGDSFWTYDNSDNRVGGGRQSIKRVWFDC